MLLPLQTQQLTQNKIKGEIYKWMANSQVCVEKMTEAFNRVMERGVVPAGWKTLRTYIIPNTKKREPTDHRPIALTNVIGYSIFMI